MNSIFPLYSQEDSVLAEQADSHPQFSLGFLPLGPPSMGASRIMSREEENWTLQSDCCFTLRFPPWQRERIRDTAVPGA